MGFNDGTSTKPVTYLRIFYEEMKRTVVNEQPKIELEDLIANVGGLLGLFTAALVF